MVDKERTRHGENGDSRVTQLHSCTMYRSLSVGLCLDLDILPLPLPAGTTLLIQFPLKTWPSAEQPRSSSNNSPTGAATIDFVVHFGRWTWLPQFLDPLLQLLLRRHRTATGDDDDDEKKSLLSPPELEAKRRKKRRRLSWSVTPRDSLALAARGGGDGGN